MVNNVKKNKNENSTGAAVRSILFTVEYED